MHGLVIPDPGEPLFCARCAHPLEAHRDGGRPRPRCPSCGWTYYAKPALGAATIIEDEAGRLLLVQRANNPYQGWWTLPTGFVEYGEDAAETAAREVWEETGLVVHITGYQSIYSGSGDPRGSSHVAVFTAQRVGGELKPGDDAADARWFTADEIPTEIAFEGHRKAIARWQQVHGEHTAQPRLTLFAGGGPAFPALIYAVIENPSGSTERIRYDAETHDFRPTGERFGGPLPFHYGWMPRTWTAGDDRELDVVVLGEGEAAVGSVIAVRPVGALLRENRDHKVVAIRAVTDLQGRPDLTAPIEEIFKPRGGVIRWARAPETRGVILDAQRDWITRKGAV